MTGTGPPLGPPALKGGAGGTSGIAEGGIGDGFGVEGLGDGESFGGGG